MSPPLERRRVAALAWGLVRARWRRVVVLAAIGLALGFAWGIADQPRYTATASVVVNPPPGGELDPAALERLAALGSSDEVATVAAGVLGDDVAGADLLSDVAVEPAASGATLVVLASSELPDFAAAAADGFAEALVEVAADHANASYRRASKRLDERIADLDPQSPEAIAVGKRIADLEVARATDPLTLGAGATLPDSPSENRPAGISAVVGLGLGLLLGLLATLIPRRRAAEEDEPETLLEDEDEGMPAEPEDEAEAMPEPEPEPADEPEPEPEDEPEPAELVLERLGIPLLASLEDPGTAVGIGESGTVVVAPPADRSFAAAAAELQLDGAEAPRTLAVLGALSRDGAAAVAAGLAIAAADLEVRVLVVDADLGGATLAERLGVEPVPGLGDYLGGAANPREVLRSIRVELGGGEPRTLVCVPAGEPGREHGGGVAGARFEALVERLPRVYDLVVFAGPSLLDGEGEDAAALAEAVEAVVLVAADDDDQEDSRDGLKDALRALEGDGPLGVVLSRQGVPERGAPGGR